MEIIEKDLEDLMFKDIVQNRSHGLNRRGFKTTLAHYGVRRKVYWNRQVNLKCYGIADLIGYTLSGRTLLVDIIELKNRPLKSEDFDQVYRYKTAVEEIIENTRPKIQRRIRCYLVGPSIESGHYIQNNNSNVVVFTFAFTVEGFVFEPHFGEWQRGGGTLSIADLSMSNSHIVYPEIMKDHGPQVH